MFFLNDIFYSTTPVNLVSCISISKSCEAHIKTQLSSLQIPATILLSLFNKQANKIHKHNNTALLTDLSGGNK